MPKRVLKDAFISINAVDLSDQVRSVTIDYSADAQEATAMGDSTHGFLSGLKNWTLNIEFYQDYAAGEIDATLFSLVGGAAVPIEVRGSQAAVGATNPKYTASGIVESYNPVAGAVGDTQMASVSIRPAAGSTGTLTRATA